MALWRLLAAAVVAAAAAVATVRAQDVEQAASAELGGQGPLTSECAFSFKEKTAGLIAEQGDTQAELHLKGFRSIQFDSFGCAGPSFFSCVGDYDLFAEHNDALLAGDTAFCPAGTAIGVMATARGPGHRSPLVSPFSERKKLVITMLQPVPWLDLHLVDFEIIQLTTDADRPDETMTAPRPSDGPAFFVVLYLNGQRVELVVPSANIDTTSGGNSGVYRIAAATPHGVFDKVEVMVTTTALNPCVLEMALPCDFIEGGADELRKRDVDAVAHAPAPPAAAHYRADYTDVQDDDDDDDDDDDNHHGHGGETVFTQDRHGVAGADDDDDDNHSHHSARGAATHEHTTRANNLHSYGRPTLTVAVSNADVGGLDGSAQRCVTDMQQFGYGSVWEQSPTRLPNNRGVKSLKVVGRVDGVRTDSSPGRQNDYLFDTFHDDNDGSGIRTRAFCAVGDHAGAVVPRGAAMLALDQASYYQIVFTHPVSDARIEMPSGSAVTVRVTLLLRGAVLGSRTANADDAVVTLSAGAGAFDEVRLSVQTPSANPNKYLDGFCIRAIEVVDCHWFADDDDDDDGTESSVSSSDFFESFYFYTPVPYHNWAPDDDDDDDAHHHNHHHH